MFIKLNIFLIIILNIIESMFCGRNKNLIINKKGLEDVDPFGIGLIFFLDLNNTSNDAINLEIVEDQCCLDNDDNVDCESLNLIGCSDIISGGTSKTIKLVAPISEDVQFKGYCIAHIDTWGEDRRKMRNPIQLNFDIKLQDTDIKKPFNICSTIDQDPFNDCRPVDCELHYNGYKPIFDNKTKRCVPAVNCLTNTNKILNPYINKCVENSVHARDIEFIKSLAKNERRKKDVIILKNNNKLDESVATQLCNAETDTNFNKDMESKEISFLKSIQTYFSCNKYTFSILGLVIVVQCILICSMIYFVTKSCGCNKKNVERKYFNDRQDASDTTPLIDTSKMDTETADYQYLSDSSNIDKKIKCYKACQKERKNNVQFSLSDDILTRCINRRDWTKPKSDTIPELHKEDFRIKEFEPKVDSEIDGVEIKIENIDETKPTTEGKVMATADKTVNIIEDKNVNLKLQGLSSEKVILCHSYNSNDMKSNFSDSSVQNKNSRSSKEYHGNATLSTGKAAQASFSNDSVDEFLSERGLLYLAGQDMSKYTLTSSSNPAKSSTSTSSRTSKNNIVKNVLSLLRRKSKVSSSDPILKSKQSIDLELIHMSKASVFSSSNDSDCKRFKRLTDSRTSL